jgi:hypothetical protein
MHYVSISLSFPLFAHIVLVSPAYVSKLEIWQLFRRSVLRLTLDRVWELAGWLKWACSLNFGMGLARYTITDGLGAPSYIVYTPIVLHGPWACLGFSFILLSLDTRLYFEMN